jgi:hypothetical protein
MESSPLSADQRRDVFHRLLSGLSYEETALQTGVTREAVEALWREFGNGIVPGFESVTELSDALAQVAAEIGKEDSTAGDVRVLLRAMQSMAKAGIEPSQLKEYAQLFNLIGQQSPEVPAPALKTPAPALRTRPAREIERERRRDTQVAAATAVPIEERYRTLEAVAVLRDELTRLEDLRVERQDLERDLRAKRRQQRRVVEALRQNQEQVQHLSMWAIELEARASRAEARVAGAKTTSDALRALGLTTDKLHLLALRLSELAEGQQVGAGVIPDRLLKVVEDLIHDMTLENTIRAQQAERERLAGVLSGLELEQKRLEGLLDEMREQAMAQVRLAGEVAASAVSESVAQVRLAGEAAASAVSESVAQVRLAGEAAASAVSESGAQVRLAGEAAASTVSESAAQIKSQLDSLVQQALDLAARIARLDADLRTKEWLSRLLILVEGKEELGPREVNVLVLGLLESLRSWAGRRREVPDVVRRDLEQLIKRLQDWHP